MFKPFEGDPGYVSLNGSNNLQVNYNSEFTYELGSHVYAEMAIPSEADVNIDGKTYHIAVSDINNAVTITPEVTEPWSD